MPTRNISLTPELDAFVAHRIESGRFESASEVVRTALRSLEREERDFDLKMTYLRQAIEEGFASGIAKGYVFGKVRKRLRLPARKR